MAVFETVIGTDMFLFNQGAIIVVYMLEISRRKLTSFVYHNSRFLTPKHHSRRLIELIFLKDKCNSESSLCS
jgi:hypothetical protein